VLSKLPGEAVLLVAGVMLIGHENRVYRTPNRNFNELARKFQKDHETQRSVRLKPRKSVKIDQ
jgi:hypothetical protein